ncbi:lysozyme inhibitor LprI family protein [Yersinia enterocolitica]|uniref:lysozyme inhibitor LprI family protein n=1 Tax=Yersinia enterocolitica TaxID=630 RepID=UPI003D7B29B6
MKKNIIYRIAPSIILVGALTQTSMAAESAEILYRQCQARTSSVEQRECYPAVEKQSETELVAAEKKARASMVDLENISEGSRSVHPVQAFDHAELAYRAFRAAESHRVLASYGSGNGGDLAAYQTGIEMNLARIKLLRSQ